MKAVRNESTNLERSLHFSYSQGISDLLRKRCKGTCYENQTTQKPIIKVVQLQSITFYNIYITVRSMHKMCKQMFTK